MHDFKFLSIDPFALYDSGFSLRTCFNLELLQCCVSFSHLDVPCDVEIRENFLFERSIQRQCFNSTSRYLDDLLNIDNIYFDQMVDRIYPTELLLNRANSSDTGAPFLVLNL